MRLHPDSEVFLGRATRLDPAALVRLRGGDGVVRLWCWLPTEVLVTRAVPGDAPADTTVSAGALLEAVRNRTFGVSVLPPAKDVEWRGALPPQRDGDLLDSVPIEVVERILTAGERTFRQASGTADPQAVGDALFESVVLTVTSGQLSAEVPLKGLLSLARMGFLGAGQAGAGRPVGVALVGNWLRLSASHGDAYLRRADRLGLFPAT